MKNILFTVLAPLIMIPTVASADEPPVVAQSNLHANLTGPSRLQQQTGQGVYNAICAACHMPDGKGGAGAGYYPALASNPKLQTWVYPATLILKGHGAMPGFSGQLTDSQIVTVIGYIRTHFGNKYDDTVSVDQIKTMRSNN